MKPDGSAKKLPWYAWAVLVVILVLCLPSLIPAPRSINSESPNVINNGRQLGVCIELYAGEHQGQYPHTLEEVVKVGIIEQSYLDKLLSDPEGKPGRPLGWIYLSGLNDKIAPDYPIFVSPILQEHTEEIQVIPSRIIIFRDHSHEVITELDFQVLLKKHSITLPAAETTNTSKNSHSRTHPAHLPFASRPSHGIMPA